MAENPEDDNPIWPTIIFIVLNLLFISLLFVGVNRFSSGAAAYEEAYAKKIALLIDYARPGMTLEINISKPLEVCRSNKCNEGDMVRIQNGVVRVKLTSTKSDGYSFLYFRNYTCNIFYKEEIFTIKIEDVK